MIIELLGIWTFTSILFLSGILIAEEINIIDNHYTIYGFPYSDNKITAVVIVMTLGLLNFIVFPLWYYYKRREARLDKMIEELKS